jgi:hypothetical protein
VVAACFLGARQQMAMSDCHENSETGPPHPTRAGW